jgi:transcriptional regulator with XRE-family HTH domain
MQREQFTPAEFAVKLGIDRSSISHFISGRNKPGREFIEKVLSAFPAINARWFILGEGEPYISGAATKPSLFETLPPDNNVTPVKTTIDAPTPPAPAQTDAIADKQNKKIEEIVVLNADGTFGRYVKKG